MTFFRGSSRPAGMVQLHVERGAAQQDGRGLWSVVRLGLPVRDLPEIVYRWRLRNLPHLWRGLRRVWLAQSLGLPHFYGTLYLDVLRPAVSQARTRDLLAEYAEAGAGLKFIEWARQQGVVFERTGYGLASMRVVTTAGVDFIVDAFQNSVEVEILKYHGIGTGTTAEAAGDTALETELTTQYQTDNTRATGTTTEGASANIYRTVGTNTVDASVAITEHGILSQAATGGGTLLDRSVFSAVNLASGDSLQSTYDLAFSSGG